MRAPASPALLACLLLLGAQAGCTGDDGGGPDSDETPAPTVYFDCAAVADAQQALTQASSAELDRLGLTPTDPQALTVTLVAGSVAAPGYWAAVRGAATEEAPASLQADLVTLDEYWRGLADDLATITIADAEPATVSAAGQQLAEVSSSAPDERVAPAQQRVEEAVDLSCG